MYKQCEVECLCTRALASLAVGSGLGNLTTCLCTRTLASLTLNSILACQPPAQSAPILVAFDSTCLVLTQNFSWVVPRFCTMRPQIYWDLYCLSPSENPPCTVVLYLHVLLFVLSCTENLYNIARVELRITLVLLFVLRSFPASSPRSSHLCPLLSPVRATGSLKYTRQQRHVYMLLCIKISMSQFKSDKSDHKENIIKSFPHTISIEAFSHNTASTHNWNVWKESHQVFAFLTLFEPDVDQMKSPPPP